MDRVVRKQDVPWLILLTMIVGLGVAVILYQTRSGPGLASDSVIYLQGAQNLQMGRGFSRTMGDGETSPITDFPPLFSTFLALFSFGNVDLDHLLQVGRWMNAVLFGGNILLASWLVRRYTASWGAAVLTGGLTLVFRRLIKIHVWLMTEGTFIFLLLLAILFLDRFFIRRRRRDLVMAGLAMGLLILTRYAGLAFLFSAMLALWFFQGGKGKERLSPMILLGILGLAPLILWGMRNACLSGEVVANRQVGWYSIKPEVIRTYLREWSAWFWPVSLNLPLWSRVGIALVLLGVLLIPFLIQKRRIFTEALDSIQRSKIALPGLLLVAIPIYLILLLANSFFLDASTTVNAIPRYLLPAWVCFLVLAVCSVYEVLVERPSLLLPRLLVSLYLLGLFGIHVVDTVAYLGHAGYGLMDVRNAWQQERAGLERLNPSRPLVSTDPERLYLLIDRPSYRTPRPQAVYTRAENARYQQELDRIRQLLQGGAYLVIVDPEVEEEAYLKELTQGLAEVITEPHVRVYAWEAQP